MIRRWFTRTDEESMRQLCTSLERPHLEYGGAIAYPRCDKDKKLLQENEKKSIEPDT